VADSWLDFANLSDEYERKARFLPAVLTALPLLPASAALGGPALEWGKLVLGGVGIGAIVAVGLSHAASAMGNRLQKQLWPRWPYDSPTNRRLHPADESVSRQQRELWYAAVKRLVGIDLAAAVESGVEIDATIDNAVSALRNLFWDRAEASRLRLHNIDYGFARNLTGMRAIWVAFLVASAAACWIAYFAIDGSALLWSNVSTLLAIILVPTAFWILPGYVRAKAVHYAESFFGTLMAVDRAKASAEGTPRSVTGTPG
jgi:hypothetical protein